MPNSSKAAASGGLTVVPDPGKRLSDGVLVGARIRARLLGIPLLKIDATVVLAPAGLKAPASTPRDLRVQSSAEPVVTGRALAEAVRSIHEGADLLADARRNGS